MGLRGCLRVLLPHNRGEPWPDVATAAARLRCTLRELPEEIRLGVWIPEEDKPEFQDSMLAWLGQLQAAMDGCPLLFQMHLAESRKRRAACDGAIFRLFEQGLIPCSGTARTALIHAIWLDPTELRALVGRRDHLGVITCPKFVDGRLAPIKELLQGGVPVGLGSDVAAADPLGLIRTLTALHQSRAESLRLSAGEAFHIATLGGAGVLGLEKQIGSLEAGKDADIVLLRSPAAIDPDLIAPGGSERHSQEKAKVIERLFVRNVLRREHIDTVIVAGRVIVDGGTLISRDHEAAIVAAGKRAAGAIVKRLVSAGREARNGE
jgi:cytosine/adenosine deaminase-related metal-dependent hydrolase